MNADSVENISALQQMNEEQNENNPGTEAEKVPEEDNPSPQQVDGDLNVVNLESQGKGAPNENNPAAVKIGEEGEPHETSRPLTETLNEVNRQLEELRRKIDILQQEQEKNEEKSSEMKDRLQITSSKLCRIEFAILPMLQEKANSEEVNDLKERVEEVEDLCQKKFPNLFGRCANMNKKIKELESSPWLQNSSKWEELSKKIDEIVIENKMLKENKILEEKVKNLTAENSKLTKQIQEVSQKKAKFTGIVTDFNRTAGNGHIKCFETGEKIFVHNSGIVQNDPEIIIWHIKTQQRVEFDKIYRTYKRRYEAINVTGPNGAPVIGYEEDE